MLCSSETRIVGKDIGKTDNEEGKRLEDRNLRN